MTGRRTTGIIPSSLQSRERVIIREIMARATALEAGLAREAKRKAALAKVAGPEEAALRAGPVEAALREALAITEKAVETAPETAMREKAEAMRAGSLLTRISRRSQPRTG